MLEESPTTGIPFAGITGNWALDCPAGDAADNGTGFWLPGDESGD
jgi:hypothetical protein